MKPNGTSGARTQAGNQHTNSKEKIRAHFAWQETVAARKQLSKTSRLAAWVLALHRNIESDRCDVSYTGIAQGMGASERTAIRAVAELEAAGLITIERGGGAGHRNQFWFVNPPERVTEPCHSSVSERVTKRAKNYDKTPQKTLTELCHPNMLNTLGASNKKPPNTGERENQPSADLFSSPGAADALTGAAPKEDQTEQSELSPAESSPQSLGEPNLPKKEGLPRAEQVEKPRPKPGSERDAGFEKERLAQSFAELRALWRRGHPADDTEKAVAIARAAYAKAIAQGAQPDEIFEAAKQWVAAADAPRFLPALPSWLATQGYLKPPLEKKRTREPARGNGAHRSGYGNGHYRRPSLAERMLALSETEA
jgi:hypothetical protein